MGDAADYECAWAADDVFGAALKKVLGESASPEEQMAGVYGVQRWLHEHAFPKAEVALIEKVFITLYNEDIIEEDGFMAWKDDLTNPVEGKIKALFQITQ